MRYLIFISLFWSSLHAWAQKPQLILPIGHTNAITTACFSLDGNYVLTGSEDKIINLWDAEGRKINILYGHQASIFSLAFSPNSDSILSLDTDGIFKIWDLQGKLLNSYDVRAGQGGIFHLSPSDRRIFHAHPDKILIWNFKGEQLETVNVAGYQATSIAYESQSNSLLVGLKSGELVLWDIEKRTEVKRIRAHKAPISSAKFSPDGEYIISSSEKDSHLVYKSNVAMTVRTPGSVKIWDLAGKLVFEFKSREIRGDITHLLYPETFFASNSSVAFAFSRDSIRSYDITNAQEKAFPKASAANKVLAFSALGDAYLLTGRSDESFLSGRAAYVDLYTKENTRLFKSLRSAKVNAAELSPDKSTLVLGTDHDAFIWNFTDRQKEKLYGPSTNRGQMEYRISRAVGFSEESTTALSLNGPANQNFKPSTYLISNAHKQDSGKKKFWRIGSGSLELASISKNGKYAVISTNARTSKKNVYNLPELWDLENQQKIADFPQKDLYPQSIAISESGDLILIGYSRGFCVLWNKNGEKLLGFSQGKVSKDYARRFGERVHALEFSPNSNSFLLSRKNILEHWSTRGELIFRYGNGNASNKALAFSQDGNSFISGDEEGKLNFWKKNTPNPVSQIQAHDAAIVAVKYLKDENYILSSSEDAMTKIWTKSGKEVASLLLLEGEDWVVTSPNGQFDASQGAMKSMHYVQGNEVIELSQLKERYYEPGLLSKLLGYNDEPIREVKEIKKLDLFPESELEIKGQNLGIKLNPREGGIGRVALVIEGREVAVDLDPQKDTVLNVDLEDYQKYLIDGEINKIGIRTYNAEGDLESQVNTVSFVPQQKESSSTEINSKNGGEEKENDDAPKFKEHARLFALCIGTSDYNGGEQLDLSYADKDAEQMANAIRLSADSLYIKDRPMVMVMNTTQDATKPTQKLPSRNNIKAALDSIASLAEPQDVFILYLSGHGKSYNDRWYYLTYEMNNDILSDATNRNERSISSDTLKVWMTQIAARKQILMLDACSSGKLNQDFDLLNQKDIPSSQRRALERLGDRAGLFVISASTANQVSYEASPYGMGLLTYALLMGMNGPALSENADVNVSKLFNFASQKVPTLASYINKVQQPMIYRPETAEDYPIGRLPVSIRSKIKIPAPKPLFSKTHFSNLESFLDDLGLMNEVNTRLREYNYLGAESQLIFIEGDDFDQAYKIAGGYTLSGEEVSVEVQVYREGKKFGEKFSFTRKRSELTSLAEEIVGEAFSQIPAK